MHCKKCLEFIRADCMLENNICVFCYYKTKSWDSNGQVVKKSEAITNYHKTFMDWRKPFIKYYKDLNKTIKTLPKGTIHKKKIKKYFYYYLVYRKNGKITFDYLGKVFPKELNNKIKFRQQLTKKINNFHSIFYSLRITRRFDTKINRFQIFKRDNFTCQYCGKTRKEGAKLAVDHIVPKCKGGKDTKKNLITACKICNSDKHVKDIK